MPQDDLDAQVRRLIASGASDDDITFYIQQTQSAPSLPGQSLPGDIDLDAPPSMQDRLARTVEGNIRNPQFKKEGLAPALAALAAGPGWAALSGLKPLLLQAVRAGAGGTAGALLAGSEHPLQEGGIQGAIEGGGLAAQKGLKLLARGGMHAAIRPPQALREEFPDIAQTALDKRVIAGRGGLRKTEALESAASAKTNARLAEADAAMAPPVEALDLTRSPRFTKVKEKFARRDLNNPDLGARAELDARLTGLDANVQPMSLTHANLQKREAQEMADKVFRASERGNVVNDSTGHIDKALAQAWREAIEKHAAEVGVTDIRALNSETRNLEGLRQGLSKAVDRPGMAEKLMSGVVGFGTGAASGNPLAGLAAGGGLMAATDPRVMSGAAIGMNELGNVPWQHVMRTLLLSLLGQDEPQP